MPTKFSDYTGFTQTGTGAVARTFPSKERDIVSVFDYMTAAQIADVQAGTLTLDVTTAVQAALTYTTVLGRVLLCPAGLYKITATLIKASSFDGVNMVGEGYYRTRFSYATGTLNTACLRIVGGSGALCGANIEGIGFDGNANTWGVEIQGQDGQTMTRCQFGLNKRGIVFHNNAVSSFTEYCVADSCDFTVNCVSAVEYKITSGAASFNGSGLANNCTINANSTNPVIIVGAGCLPYNAPLSVMVWTTAATTLIQNLNTTALDCNWYGSIRCETNTNLLTLASSAVAGTTRSFFLGHLIGHSEYMARGALIHCLEYAAMTNGSNQFTLAPQSVSQASVVNNSAITFNPGYGNGQEYATSLLVHIGLVGVNYHYSYIAVFTPAAGQGGSDVITTLATQQTFNTAGWGTATFTINGSGQLVVANASGGFSVTAYVGISPIGAGLLN